MIGAGSFFRGVHLPNLKKHGGFFLKHVVSRGGPAVRDLAERAGVPFASSDPASVLEDPEVQAVFIATRHASHAALVERAAAAGKHVFVEKPLGLSAAECRAAADAVARAGVVAAVGFNRRTAPLAVTLRTALDGLREPRVVVYRVNAGPLPADHWLLDAAEGGGRLHGEGVHFFDFVRWLIGARVVGVSASARRRPSGVDLDNVAVSLTFEDGSLGTVHYVSQGHASLGKERVECFGGGRAWVLDDFQRLEVAGEAATARS